MADTVNIDTSFLGKYPQLGRGPMPSVEGLVVHHTGADTSVQSIIDGWAGSKGATGAQFVMDRSGTIYQILPDGTRANQTIKSWNPAIPWASNSTTEGIEIMAKDDKDVTPAQTAALTAFAKQQAAKWGYDPATHVVGHGEINGVGAPRGTPGTYLRQPTEGMSAVNALRASLSDSPAQDSWASAFSNAGKPATSSALSAINAATATPPLPPQRPNASAPMANAGDALGFGTPTSSGLPSFTKVISGGGDAPLVVQGSDGRTYTVAGDQNAKYNNPTAMKYDQFAIDHGAIGSSSRPGQTPLAVFPDMATGQAAARQRLFGDNSKYSIPGYKDMTLAQAIKSWAPGGVDGNRDPTSYINGIAKSLGITPDTKLSALSPDQQAQFVAAQQHQEGSKPQVITDSSGNVVSSGASGFGPTLENAGVPVQHLGANDANIYPSMDAQINPATGLMTPNMNSAASRSNFLPALPNSSGAPDDRSLTQPSTFPSRPSIISPNNAGALTPPISGPALTEAQKLAMIAMPPAVPSAPIPMPASARPAAPALPTNSKGYVIGQEYPMANGAMFRANADGSFTKTASTPRSPTAIQTLFTAMQPGVMQTAGNLVNGAKSAGPATIDAAKGIGSSIGSAATGISSLLGGIFNHATAPAAPTAQSYGYAPGQVGQSPATPAPPSLPSTFPALPSFPSPNNTGNSTNYSAPSPTPYESSGWNVGAPPSVSGLSPADLSSYSAPSVPKTITQQVVNPAYLAWANGQSAMPASPFSNPGVQGLSPDDRQALNDANNAAALSSAARSYAPSHYITRTVPNPNYAAPPLAYPTAGNPFASAFNRTHIGGLLSLLNGGQNASDMLFGGGSTGVNRVPQLPSLFSIGLTPQQYNASTPEYRAAVAAGQGGYTPAGSNTLMPTTTISGGYRQSYGDSSSSGSLASRG